ncbi:hypothetical protein [Pseudoponticoccus marisrubri]|uniref:Uncharacterized protein n=1 Tax=Pseudoponticoccus marisrubri TaxID=1685382 RepID=A0A0W7WKJ3_9RHOB|nr:hypothetical protein [Pseudoponticoccus marisrubri]KUF11099.1 hypothetical protein AVJ23_08555 [Pseudoponticoccus marisrubri]
MAMELISTFTRPAARIRRAPPRRIAGPTPRPGRGEMLSLLIATAAGALLTGGMATLIMMSGPVHASPTQPAETPLLPRQARLESWAETPAGPNASRPGTPPDAPWPGLRALSLPPVCTCTLPAHNGD